MPGFSPNQRHGTTKIWDAALHKNGIHSTGWYCQQKQQGSKMKPFNQKKVYKIWQNIKSVPMACVCEFMTSAMCTSLASLNSSCGFDCNLSSLQMVTMHLENHGCPAHDHLISSNLCIFSSGIRNMWVLDMPSDHDANKRMAPKLNNFSPKLEIKHCDTGSFNTTRMDQNKKIWSQRSNLPGRGKEGRRGSWSKRSVFGCNRVQRFSAWLSPGARAGLLRVPMALCPWWFSWGFGQKKKLCKKWSRKSKVHKHSLIV